LVGDERVRVTGSGAVCFVVDHVVGVVGDEEAVDLAGDGHCVDVECGDAVELGVDLELVGLSSDVETGGEVCDGVRRPCRALEEAAVTASCRLSSGCCWR
jgi:hypothetical protein